MKLVLHTIALADASYTFDTALTRLRVNGADVPLVGLASANALAPADTAVAIANAVNATAVSHNGKTVRAVAYANIVAVAVVEQEGEQGVAIVAVSGLSDASTWSTTAIQDPYIDPNADVVTPEAINAKTIAAFAAGAVLARMVK